MSREQIEEMAKIIDDNHGFIVSSVETAEALYTAGYRKAEDVAAEIFAEIEKIIEKEIHRCESIRESYEDLSQRKYWEGGESAVRKVNYWIAKLKKKHIGEDTNVTTKDTGEGK